MNITFFFSFALALVGTDIQAQESSKEQPNKSTETASQQQPSLTPEQSKKLVSYYFGFEAGSNLSEIRVKNGDIDPEMYFKAMQDALADKKFAMPEEQTKVAIDDFEQALNKRYKELRETNFKEGDAFLKNNAKQPGVISLPSGVQYKILEKGGDKTAETFHYRLPLFTVVCTGTLLNGKKIVTTGDTPQDVPLSGITPALQEILPLMPIGAKWIVYAPSDMAYGIEGNGMIPPCATIIYHIELLEVKETPVPQYIPDSEWDKVRLVPLDEE